MAVNQIACWVALMVMGCCRSRPSARHGCVLSATVAMVVVAGGTGVDGLLLHPYRTDAYRAATRPSEDRASWRDSRSRPSARKDLEQPGGESASPEARRQSVVMAFDEMPGLVLLLDARTPGEAWYSATDRDRTAAGIRSSCAMLARTQTHRPRCCSTGCPRRRTARPWPHAESSLQLTRRRSDWSVNRTCWSFRPCDHDEQGTMTTVRDPRRERRRVSVVVPALNECANMSGLVERMESLRLRIPTTTSSSYSSTTAPRTALPSDSLMLPRRGCWSPWCSCPGPSVHTPPSLRACGSAPATAPSFWVRTPRNRYSSSQTSCRTGPAGPTSSGGSVAPGRGAGTPSSRPRSSRGPSAGMRTCRTIRSRVLRACCSTGR